MSQTKITSLCASRFLDTADISTSSNFKRKYNLRISGTLEVFMNLVINY